MSLIASIARVAAQRPLQTALITERSQLSYGDLLGIVAVLDLQLTARGVRSGQTVVLSSTRAEFTLGFALLASLRSLRVIFSGIGNVQQAGIGYHWAIASEPMATVPPERQIIMDAGWFAGLGQTQVPDYTGHVSTAAAGLVNQTSGSTGRPKFVLSTEDQWRRKTSVNRALHGLDIRNRRVGLTASPANNWAMVAAMTVLQHGGSLLMLSGDHDRLPAYLDLYHVDLLSTTPAMLAHFLQIPDAGQFLGGLRDIRLGGALTANSLLKAVSAITPARLHVGYGATEIDTGFFYHRHDPDDPPPEGFLGPLVNEDLELAFFTEDLQPLPPEATEGVLGVRKSNPADERAYLVPDAPVGTTEPITGIYFPGDILRRDATGYQYVGRVSNLINFSGEKYSLDLIASYLATVFGGRLVVPMIETDAEGLEQLVLVAAGDAPLDADRARAALAARFPAAPLAGTLLVPEIPITLSGKVDRTRLREMMPDRETLSSETGNRFAGGGSSE